ncbi:MAG: M14 family metallopeptidase [Proteobacteria bacterium]|nr:M14 family metallopeptidase [Pseudomonadota bacterium]
MRSWQLAFFLGLCLASPVAAADWTTPAELAGFRTTPSYSDTLAYLKRLEEAAPGKIRLQTFGISPQGRPMVAVIANANGVFTPEGARAAKLPVILVQAGIHPGEIEGKDAGLMLLRDFAATGKSPHLLDHAVLVFIPVFSVDGHENSSPYNRINQNGPDSMGFRGQSQYLNLNRDYVKADTPEMRAWLSLWRHWRPDFLTDIHTTDGADYQYDLTWYLEDPNKLDAAVSDWQQKAMAAVIPPYEKRGHLASIYLEFKDGKDPRQGIVNFGSGPRFSTGYAALQNRPALLIETHMLKPYAVRVRAAYDLVALLLEHVGRDPAALLAATAKADADTVQRAQDASARVALTFKPDPVSTPFALKGYAFSQSHSDISASSWIQYDPGKPVTTEIPNWNRLLPDVSIAPPAAYVIPAQWTDIVARLRDHGIAYQRLDCAVTVDAEGYQLGDPKWTAQPFEGHLMLRSVSANPLPRHELVPAGSVLVPLDQPAANVAIELLEPDAPDSLLRWGMLDAIFEIKEYGEPRVLEKLARDMLAKDPVLKAEFERKLKDDAAFAANSQARLNFFFQRSPWYKVQRAGAYPVLRLNAKMRNALSESVAGKSCPAPVIDSAYRDLR